MFTTGWLNMKSAKVTIWFVRLFQRWRRKQQQFRAAGDAAEQVEQKPSKAQHVVAFRLKRALFRSQRECDQVDTVNVHLQY